MRDDGNPRGQGQFPVTRWSLIVATRSAEPEERQRALEILVAAYWKPVYKYIRLRWDKDNEQAKDLTQDFFFHLLEKDFLAKYDPQRARLRTFLRVCVDHLIANEDKAARSLKRGGEVQFLPLDFESAEGELRQIEIPSPGSMEDFFEREWVRSVFSLSLQRLRQECEQRGKQMHFRLLEFYDVDEAGRELTYEQVGQRFELKIFRRYELSGLRAPRVPPDRTRTTARDDGRRGRISAGSANPSGSRCAMRTGTP